METLARTGLDSLFEALKQRGYRVVGPTVRDQAIVYEEIDSPSALPEGWTDEQSEGRYRLTHNGGGALFDFAVGPQSWKRFLFPPRHTLWRAQRQGHGFEMLHDAATTPRYALVGVRACDLAAIAVQDRVFLGGPHVDPTYQARRESALLVAVNCTRAGGTCFCASMGSGPRCGAGFDLALTEARHDGRPFFAIEAGSEKGRELLAELPRQKASAEERRAVAEALARAGAEMGRSLDTEDLPAILARNYESPRFDDVARRCLACSNCTLVCPTCFCTTLEDTTDLAGQVASRQRVWDSCFTADHSYLHGGSVRLSPLSRYRQWLIHKLGTWHEQFGTSGCVGCGRCITWCPAAIDLTEEVRAIRAGDRAHQPVPKGENGHEHQRN